VDKDILHPPLAIVKQIKFTKKVDEIMSRDMQLSLIDADPDQPRKHFDAYMAKFNR
jgi:hypothetical protein